ncbi:MAG: hypothetical protein HZB91_03280 [Elusimicrobia bacterium]|nr:hypothetical protein [Elusimicrobiota bacterium]
MKATKVAFVVLFLVVLLLPAGGSTQTLQFVAALTCGPLAQDAERAASKPDMTLSEGFASAWQMVKESRSAAKGSPQVPYQVQELFSTPMKTIFADMKTCSNRFSQTNGNEPLATCDVAIEGIPDGIVDVEYMLPYYMPRERRMDLSSSPSISCGGGIRGDAHLQGGIQVFVDLAPWRSDYSKEIFQECFESVLTRLAAQERMLYFKVIRRQ